MTEGLGFGKGPQSPETAKIREQIASGKIDLGADFPEAMAEALAAGDRTTTAYSSTAKTTIDEWSDKWGNSGEIEVSRFERTEGDPVSYSIRGYVSSVDDIRQAAVWLTGLADALS